MRDVLGWRRKFGVLGPSTNTIVQPDFEMMRPPGVTNHYSRIFTPNAQAVSNDTFMAGTQLIGENTLEAVRSVMTCFAMLVTPQGSDVRDCLLQRWAIGSVYLG